MEDWTVLIFSLMIMQADAETEPCVVSSISQDVLLSLVNPRSSGDSKVMLNLPFSRVFCSPPVARYLLVGEWNQQNLLKLNSTQLHFGISGFPIDLKTFDVTLNSSSTTFDFMIDSGRSQLTAGADHFAALTSCNTVYCRTVGPVKFRPWRTSSVPIKIIIGASSGGVVLLILSLIAAVLLGYRYRLRKASNSAPADESPNNSVYGIPNTDIDDYADISTYDYDTYPDPDGNGGCVNPERSSIYVNPERNGAYTCNNRERNGAYNNPERNGAYNNPERNGSYVNQERNGAYNNPERNGRQERNVNPERNSAYNNPIEYIKLRLTNSDEVVPSPILPRDSGNGPSEPSLRLSSQLRPESTESATAGQGMGAGQTRRTDVATQYRPPFTEAYQVTLPQGICAIFNINKYNAEARLEQRFGSEIDLDRIQQTFGRLGFIIQMHQDLTGAEIHAKLSEISTKHVAREHGCFVCFLMAHGCQGHIFGKNGIPIRIDTLTGLFSSNICESLSGKPKLFFIQACRGTEWDIAPVSPTPPQKDGPVLNKSLRPTQSDVLICNSTVEGSPAFRDPDQGSRFIRTLCDVIEEQSAAWHIEDVMREVNNRMTSEPVRDGNQYCHTVPKTESTLSKKCYLDPKWSETCE